MLLHIFFEIQLLKHIILYNIIPYYELLQVGKRPLSPSDLVVYYIILYYVYDRERIQTTDVLKTILETIEYSVIERLLYYDINIIPQSMYYTNLYSILSYTM